MLPPSGPRKSGCCLPSPSTRQTSAPSLYPFAGVVGARAELAPFGHRLADGFGATGLAGGQVGGFKSQCVVFIAQRCFLREFAVSWATPHCLFGLQKVFGEPFQHLLLQARVYPS